MGVLVSVILAAFWLQPIESGPKPDDAIHKAAASGNLVELNGLLDRNASAINQKDSDGRCPLHLAVAAGRLDAGRLLIDRGADPNAEDGAGRTPLLLACERSDFSMFAMLLSSHARIDTRDKAGRTPMISAIMAAGDSEQSRAAQLKIVRSLIRLKGSVRAADSEGMSPIHAAATRGRIEVARLLLKHGAKVTQVDQKGRTPLHVAAMSGQVKFIEFLLEAGADIEAKDKEGETALHVAARRARTGVIRCLIEHRSNPSAGNHRGQTPLHLIADQGEAAGELDALLTECAEVLLGAGADPRAVDVKSRTPIELATIRGHVRLATRLSSGGPHS